MSHESKSICRGDTPTVTLFLNEPKCDNISSATPYLSTSFNQYYSEPVIHLAGPPGYFIFLYGHKRNTTERGGKKEQTSNMVYVSSKRKKASFVTPCIHCASVDNRRRVFFVKLLQTTRNANSSWLFSLTASFCWPLSTASLHLPSPTGPVFSRTFLSSSSSSLVGDLKFKPFVWISHQNWQRDCLPGASPT